MFLKPMLGTLWNKAQLPRLTSPFSLEAKKPGVGMGEEIEVSFNNIEVDQEKGILHKELLGYRIREGR